MSLIVDASVAVKWLSEEPDSQKAEAVLAGPDTLLAPELILVEIANALRKKQSQNALTKRQALDAIAHAPHFFERLVPLQDLLTRAAEIALSVQHPVYDCFYLALAERERADLVTADARLVAIAQKAKVRARTL